MECNVLNFQSNQGKDNRMGRISDRQEQKINLRRILVGKIQEPLKHLENG